MNLDASIELYAGGPGSGCQGDNCGRKKGNLQDAIQLATKAHEGQLDKSGFPYIDHPLRVGESLKEHGEVAQIAGVLHDVVEDTPVKLKEIEEKFGKEVADTVDSVSHRAGEPYFDFVRRSNQHPIGRLVKIADIHDNMLPSRTKGRNLEKLQKKYAKALEILK
jgi:(p)ppGpp synthase/HD superfamily hydrolase